MSRITNALEQAQQQRQATDAHDATNPSGYFSALKQELREEWQWVNGMFGKSTTSPPAAPHTVSAPSGAAPVSLEQALALAKTQLAEQERQREETSRALAAIEAARATSLRRLELLQECQRLSQALKTAEQELQAQHAAIAHLTQSKQRIEEETGRAQQRADALQQQVGTLRFNLAQSLAFTGIAAQR